MAIKYNANSILFESIFLPRSYTNLYLQNYPSAFNAQMWEWGDNAFGQLGQNNVTHRSSPVQVGSITGWKTVSSNFHCLAVKYDGTLWSWGRNTWGELGDNSVIHRSSPVQIGALTNWSQITAVQSGSSIAIKTDGSLWGWGQGSYGQIGNGSVQTFSSPVQVGSLTNWLLLASGQDHIIAIKSDYSLWAWGHGRDGGLGDGTIVNKSTPVQIGTLYNWSKISAGGYSSAAIKTDGTLWAWGQNNNGHVGNGTVIPRSSPVQIGSLTNWRTISIGGAGTSAIKTDGTLWSWGPNLTGQLGDGTIIHRSSPVQVGSLTNWKLSSVTGHNGASLQRGTFSAIKTNGTLWVWGQNGVYGLLGNNDASPNTDVSSPVQVGSLNYWKTLPSRQPDSNLIAFA
jgi:alpha-tubulin suppressor-like RCC1 family protein